MPKYTSFDLECWGESELIELVLKLQAKKELNKVELENEILDIIDNADDMTRSDLQGVVSALVSKIERV